MSWFARVVSWFTRPRPSPVSARAPDVSVELVEAELFEGRCEAGVGSPRVNSPHESGVRMKALVPQETRRLPALRTRPSPFDAPTRRVDSEELAKALDAREASRSRTG